MRLNKVKSTFIAATLSLNVFAVSTLGQSALAADFSEMIETRQQNFKQMGGALKSIREELKQDQADIAEIKKSAATLERHANALADWFPVGSAEQSDALPAIWSKSEKFSAAGRMLIKTSTRLVAAADSQDMKQIAVALKEVKDSCSNCHKSFRAD